MIGMKTIPANHENMRDENVGTHQNLITCNHRNLKIISCLPKADFSDSGVECSSQVETFSSVVDFADDMMLLTDVSAALFAVTVSELLPGAGLDASTLSFNR